MKPKTKKLDKNTKLYFAEITTGRFEDRTYISFTLTLGELERFKDLVNLGEEWSQREETRMYKEFSRRAKSKGWPGQIGWAVSYSDFPTLLKELRTKGTSRDSGEEGAWACSRISMKEARRAALLTEREIMVPTEPGWE